MGAPFRVEARCERASISSGKTTLWAAIRVDGTGKALEAERAPLAVALVIDVSGSMKGDPIAHVLDSCKIVGDLLGERDLLAVATFANHAGVRLGLTRMDAAGRAQLHTALRDVVADGSTNMHAGIEAGAGLLVTAPAGLRRAMVVLSDGQPNIGMQSPADLAALVRSLRPLGVSTLGFGLHHDENVLAAVATAGSGRYAYVPDPITARVDLARAALAHGGILAEGLELKLKPADGVEILRVLPATQLRHGGSGIAAAIGDVFVDEGRLLALELAVDLPRAQGTLAEITITGTSPDQQRHDVHATLAVDVHAGPHAIDRAAQRDILTIRADAARAEARAHADRGALPAAAALLRDMLKSIEASDGFVANDGSALAELREQLVDEVASYERKSTDVERVHQRKGTFAYTPTVMPRAKVRSLAPGCLVAADGARLQLYTETLIGRSSQNEIAIVHDSLSRRHARILYLNGAFLLDDLGSTNGCEVNGQQVIAKHVALRHGDDVRIGFLHFRLAVDP